MKVIPFGSLCRVSGVSCYLPQVEPHDSDAVVLVDLRISGVLWVVNLGVDPLALVSRVVDLPGLPLSLGKRPRRMHG